MSNPILSVVVPIYNVERFLPKCLDSILGQTLEGVEIVCVDDGSPDGSGEIADAYAMVHPNIKVVHQVNAGLGPARNTGIEHSTGSYIAFVDSDDWIVPELYSNLIETAYRTNADIVVSGHCDATEDAILLKKVHPLAGKVLDSAEKIAEMRLNLFGHGLHDSVVEAFPMSSCMSIYSRDLIKGNSLRFQNVISEDIVFNLHAYSLANVIAFTSDTGYRYRKEGQESITGSFKPDLLAKYEELIATLMIIADADARRREAIDRVKRTSIDYCRLYVGILAQSDMARSEKLTWLTRLVNSDLFAKSKGYPITSLPLQQRVFHRCLMSGRFNTVLAMAGIRIAAKKWRRGMSGAN